MIDLTGSAPELRPPAPPAPAVPARTPAARNLWRLGLAAIAVLATALAITNYVTGMRWRAQALAAQERAVLAADDAAAHQEAVMLAQRERNTAELRRDAVAQQLAISEADVPHSRRASKRWPATRHVVRTTAGTRS